MIYGKTKVAVNVKHPGNKPDRFSIIINNGNHANTRKRNFLSCRPSERLLFKRFFRQTGLVRFIFLDFLITSIIFIFILHTNILRLLLLFEYIFLVLGLGTILFGWFTNNILLSILTLLIFVLAAADAAIGLSFLIRLFIATKGIYLYNINRNAVQIQRGSILNRADNTGGLL